MVRSPNSRQRVARILADKGWKPWLFYVAFWWSLLQSGSGAVDCGNSSVPLVSIINDASEAEALASQCHTFWGDIQIGTNASGDVYFEGITNITGYLRSKGTSITSIQSQILIQVASLDVNNDGTLQTISLPHLQAISTTLWIYDMPKLRTIDLSSLDGSGSLFFVSSTPSLEVLRLRPGINYGSLASLFISNTNLTFIDAFGSGQGSIGIGGNQRLSNVSVRTIDADVSDVNNSMVNGTGLVSIYQNGPAVNISLPNLTNVQGPVTLGNCSELSIPDLNIVNGSIMMDNASFRFLSAPNLSVINGDLNITGSFTGISSFPALYKIAGNVFVQSSQPLDCTPLQQLSSEGKVGGSFFCGGSAASPTSVQPSGPAGPISSSLLSTPTHLSAGAKGGISAGAIIGGLILLAVVVLFARRRQSSPHQQAQETARQDEADSQNPKELPGVCEEHRRELEAAPNQVHELGGDHKLPSQSD